MLRNLLRARRILRKQLKQAHHLSTTATPADAVSKMRTVGLLGGMTWQTTALYYGEINRHVRTSLGGIHSANILIRSFDYADLVSLFSTKQWGEAARLFGEAGRSMKAAGAEGIVLCANIAHKVADPVEQRAGLPVLHIADFTGAEIVRRGIGRVGLLGTRTVMEESFYRERLSSKFGLEVELPKVEFRERIDDIVFRELSQDRVTEETRGLFDRVCGDLIEKAGVQGIVLACTELRMVLKEGDVQVPLFETTELHARGVADWALAGHENDEAR